MRRTYKVPTSAIKNILKNVKVNTTLAAVESYISTSAGSLVEGLSASSVFDLPDNVDSWVVNNYQVDQNEAGEYMDLRVTYTWTYLDLDTIAELSDWVSDKTITEEVNWQPYSVSPYIYCNNKEHKDNPVVDGEAQISSETKFYTMRAHIEKAYGLNATQSPQKPYRYVNGSVWQLTEGEWYIYQKIANGVNPVFHKPIATRTTTLKSRQMRPIDLDNVPQIDRIDPDFSTADWDGQYIFCGRDYSTQMQAYYTTDHPEGISVWNQVWVDRWEGTLCADIDFYGPNAWKFHEGPTSSRNS